MRLALSLCLALISTSCLSVDVTDRPCRLDDECLGEDRCLGKVCVGAEESRDLAALTRSPLCHRVHPEEDLEAAWLFGSLLPVSGPNAERGAAREEAIRLAVDEINQAGGIDGRGVAVLSCDSASDSDQAQTAAQVLVELARVPAIVGAAASQVTIDTFNSIRDSRTLMISPSSTSPLITGQSDLLWRSAPSDATQGVAIAEVLRAHGAQRISIAHENDAYGNGLRDVVRAAFCVVDGVDRCRDDPTLVDVERVDRDSFDPAVVVERLTSAAPDAFVVVASVDLTVAILTDAAGAGLDDRIWVLPDVANQDQILDAPSAILAQIRGTTPAVAEGEAFGAFATRYEAATGVAIPPTFTPHAYDATYLLAFAAGLTGGDAGVDVRDGLRALSAGTEVPVGPIGFAAALNTLQDEGSLDLEGASGPLDFIGDATEPLGDTAGWSVVDGQRRSEGIIFEAATGQYQNPPRWGG